MLTRVGKLENIFVRNISLHESWRMFTGIQQSTLPSFCISRSQSMTEIFKSVALNILLKQKKSTTIIYLSESTSKIEFNRTFIWK